MIVNVKELAREIDRLKNRLGDYVVEYDKSSQHYDSAMKERAAARRASLDLTRMLAAWRKEGCPR